MINKKGSMTILSFTVILLILTFFMLIVIYIQNHSILKAVHESLQATVLTISTDNFDETYFSKREAVSGGFVYQGDWAEAIDNGTAGQQLKEILKLSQIGNRLVKQDAYGKTIYEISDIVLSIQNSPWQSERSFRVELKCTVHVPVKQIIFKKTLSARGAWKQKY